MERTPDPTDRRASLIVLSEEGRRVLEEYVTRASQILERTVQGWSDEDLTDFERHLSRFAADLKRSLPRIPHIERDDFAAFRDAGRRLLDLHIDYEDAVSYPVTVTGDSTVELSLIG